MIDYLQSIFGNPLAAEFFPLLPEITLAVSALILLLVGALRGDKSAPMIIRFAILALLGAALLTTQLWHGRYVAAEGFFVSDNLAIYLKITLLLGAALVLFTSLDFFEAHHLTEKYGSQFEYPILILLSVVGMMVMISANNLISLYLGLELQSLCIYVLASLNRDNVRSTEAGLKYFVLGALSSGLLLYGCSLVYGFTGTTQFLDLSGIFLLQGNYAIGAIIGMILVIIGICFKLSAVPFHMWTPDVYEGAPTQVTAYLAAVPKIAALGLFIRLLFGPFGAMESEWHQIIVFVSAASMIVGSLAAIKQHNIKRLMAYSAIGHIGYILMGLAAGRGEGIQSSLIYTVIYAVMGIGTFACILQMKKQGKLVENISDLSSISQTKPAFALIFSIFMLSQAGIPPMAGFFGKFFVFKAAITAELYTLAVIGVLMSVIGAFYYLRVIKVMYFDSTPNTLDGRIAPQGGIVILVTGLATFFYFLFPVPLLHLAKIAAAAF